VEIAGDTVVLMVLSLTDGAVEKEGVKTGVKSERCPSTDFQGKCHFGLQGSISSMSYAQLLRQQSCASKVQI
jgi:hypothetical protein